jgi:acetylornithine/N-succinyldiaminopimelate aminotransferase
MQGIEFDTSAGEIVKKSLENGLILISAGSNIIRFVPPLIIEEKDVDEMIRLLKKTLDDLGFH